MTYVGQHISPSCGGTAPGRPCPIPGLPGNPMLSPDLRVANLFIWSNSLMRLFVKKRLP